jgi:heptosyltransferase II
MRILIVQTSFLGDTILSTPVIEGLARIYPDAELWMMTTPLSVQLVKRDPLLSGVIAYDKRGSESGFSGLFAMARRIRSMGFDRVYSLHRSYRTSALLALSKIPYRVGFKEAKLAFLYHRTYRRNPENHDVIRNLSILGEHGPPESYSGALRLFAPEFGDLGVKTTQALPKEPYAVLVPGSAWETKVWHHEGFRKTAQYLLANGFRVVLLGAPEDCETNRKVADGIDVVDLAGKTSISDALYIMKHAGLVVCNDSMSLHMASAFKIPTVVIFCATSPRFGFGPWRNKARVVEKKLDCKPCSRHGGRRCPLGTDACMKDLEATEVIGAIHSVLDIT